MTRAWFLPILLALCGAAGAAGLARRGEVGGAGGFLGSFLLLAWGYSPLFFPRPPGGGKARQGGESDGRPVVYWRAGCTYCMRLRVRLGRDARRLDWVDIWRDPAAAALVRAAADGNETVPTVVVAGRAHVDPDPEWVRRQLPPDSAGRSGR